MLARCIQHETDHLDGVLFVDRLDAETAQGGDDARSARPSGAGLARAGGQGQPARPRGLALRRPVRLAFAGTPAAGRAVAARAARLARATRWSP